MFKTPNSVFLASTFADLEPYRSGIMGILVSFEKVFKGMEHFGASENTPLEVCLRNLDSTDLVLCLIGTRYGSCPEGRNMSYTQIEVERALEKEIPVYAYFLDEENQPVLSKFVDSGEERKRLESFKTLLRKQRTVEKFTTPEDLSVKVARDLYRSQPVFAEDFKVKTYRECAYDALAEWYDSWYVGHWHDEEPCRTICTVVGSLLEGRRGHLSGFKVLDCACGTGNTLVGFTREGFEAYGTDGSREMLAVAKRNCEFEQISTDRLVAEPINWTDLSGYRRHFGQTQFDLIVNTANSLCHVPPTPEYLGKALKTFYALLKPGGFLVVDTKKYIRSDPINDIPSYKELRQDHTEWIVRHDRAETVETEKHGLVTFHSRLMYDTDPSITPPVRRALIVITIFGSQVTPRTIVVPYYPLPSSLLAEEMKSAGFVTTQFPAHGLLTQKWKYDIVVGQKE